MTLNQIQADLRKARRDVFNVRDEVVPAIQANIRRLKRAMARHPEERARRARVAARQNERLAFQLS